MVRSHEFCLLLPRARKKKKNLTLFCKKYFLNGTTKKLIYHLIEPLITDSTVITPRDVRNGTPFHVATLSSVVIKSGWTASKIFFLGLRTASGLAVCLFASHFKKIKKKNVQFLRS